MVITEKSSIENKITNEKKELNSLKEELRVLEETDELEYVEEELTKESEALLKEANIPFTTLYKVIEFKDNIKEEEKSKLEELLISLNILNAKLVPAKYLNDIKNIKSVFLKKGTPKKNNILTYFNVIDNSVISKQEITDILSSISVDKSDEFYINADNYEIIKTPYLKNEVEKILKLRRANKMAKMILVMGEPASGKTVSLRNIPKNELYYIDCDKKGLNYKGWKNDFNEENKNYFKTNDGELIAKCMQGISEKREDIHYIVIDTINSIMIADEMRRSKDKNFDKWIDLASCIFNLVNIVPDLRDDITVIFIGHTQTDDEGFTRLLTNGKKLNKIGLEKYFDTVLIAKNNDGKYVFETKSPNSTARTPMGSYDDEQYIDNDLYEVIKVLKEY